MKWFLESLPRDWQTKALKRVSLLRYGDSLAVEDREDGDTPVYGSNGVVGTHSCANQLAPGLVVGRKGSYGKVTYCDEPCFVIDTAYGIDASCTRHDMRWLYYVVSSSTIESKMRDSPVPGLASRDAYRIELPVPPSTEQKRIAAYLDASCAAIDRAVATKQQQLETLDALRKSIIQKAVTQGLNPEVEVKDSGIHYLLRVPRHWKVAKLKRLIAEPLSYGLNEPGTEENPEWPRYIRITDFGADGKLRDETFRSLPPEIAETAPLKEGDILLARSGATVGKSFLFTNYAGDACYAGYLIKARSARHLLIPDYLYLYTRSHSYETWKNLIFTQATIQNISATKYGYLEVPVPPLNEQCAILDHLRSELSRTDQLEAILRNQIETITAYRKSLIHECVTGQRRITDADVAAASRTIEPETKRG